MTRQGRRYRYHQRMILVDTVHMFAIIGCLLWTAKLITDERFGSLGNMATQLSQTALQDGNSLSIRLDDGARTAAR